MSKTEGQNEAIRIAVAKLAESDLSARAGNLGFTLLDKHAILIRAFGSDCTVELNSFEVRNKKTGQPVKPDLKIIILHYLLFDNTFSETGRIITFRDLPGGQFYLGPYQSRSVDILLSRIKYDIGLLKKNLGRLEWEETRPGDIGARIHAIGRIFATLVYYKGDEEMPSSADILYDSSIRKVFNTEDVTVIASLICRSLL
ncbi:MAG TPA: hypothetical protein DET40_13430 [Lentisphaeria bacterium]|nr:MAG: hypothetical protein A2X45_22775 [Lentisphaerae bacterium GWF2_50_93]HCE44542.1 hypothetical protein [Lentisphaeria bacterium]